MIGIVPSSNASHALGEGSIPPPCTQATNGTLTNNFKNSACGNPSAEFNILGRWQKVELFSHNSTALNLSFHWLLPPLKW